MGARIYDIKKKRERESAELVYIYIFVELPEYQSQCTATQNITREKRQTYRSLAHASQCILNLLCPRFSANWLFH